jgi:Co/Zn/Cd efflux system component
MEDSFDRFYKAINRFFASPQFHLGMTIVIGLLALAITLGVILQPVPASTKITGIGASVVLWIFALTWLNWWQKWRIIYAWKREREEIRCMTERVSAYFRKVDAGEIPAEEPIPEDIMKDMRGIASHVLHDW